MIKFPRITIGELKAIYDARKVVGYSNNAFEKSADFAGFLKPASIGIPHNVITMRTDELNSQELSGGSGSVRVVESVERKINTIYSISSEGGSPPVDEI